jgi:hypothetical protein
MTEEDL